MVALPAHAAAQVSTLTEGLPGLPFSLRALDPALTSGDPLDQRLAFVTPIAGALPATDYAVSRPLDMGHPSVDKEFLSLAWTAVVPRGTSMLISYSVDGRAWLPAVGGGGFDLPESTHGYAMAYRIIFISADSTATPAVDDIGIEYTRWTGKPTDPGGSGDGTSHTPHPGAAYKPGSGTFRFPGTTSVASVASALGSGAGTGTGSGTAGEGSGATGSGASGSSAGGVKAGTATQAAGAPLPPVDSAAGGPALPVSGIAADGEQTITGTAMHSAGTGASTVLPGTAASHRGPPYAGIAMAFTLLALLLFAPWLVMAARLRRITSYDLGRARRFGPFGPIAERAPVEMPGSVRDRW